MMKALLIYCITLTGVVLMMNCSPKTTGSVTTSKPEAKNEEHETEPTPDEKPSGAMTELDEGKLLWRSSCDACHKLYDPRSHTAAQWERLIPDMGQRAKLDERQIRLVKAYIFHVIQD